MTLTTLQNRQLALSGDRGLFMVVILLLNITIGVKTKLRLLQLLSLEFNLMSLIITDF